MLRVTVNEAARHFPAVLGRVAAGEEIQVVRDGAPVAVIAPPHRAGSEEQARDVFGARPRGDSSFADDLRILQAKLEAPAPPPLPS